MERVRVKFQGDWQWLRGRALIIGPTPEDQGLVALIAEERGDLKEELEQQSADQQMVATITAAEGLMYLMMIDEAGFRRELQRYNDRLFLPRQTTGKQLDNMREAARWYTRTVAEQRADLHDTLRPHIDDYEGLNVATPLWRDYVEPLLYTRTDHPNLRDKLKDDLRWVLRDTHAAPWGEDLIRYIDHHVPAVRDDPVVEAYVGLITSLTHEDYRGAKTCQEVIIGARKRLPDSFWEDAA